MTTWPPFEDETVRTCSVRALGLDLQEVRRMILQVVPGSDNGRNKENSLSKASMNVFWVEYHLASLAGLHHLLYIGHRSDVLERQSYVC